MKRYEHPGRNSRKRRTSTRSPDGAIKVRADFCRGFFLGMAFLYMALQIVLSSNMDWTALERETIVGFTAPLVPLKQVDDERPTPNATPPTTKHTITKQTAKTTTTAVTKTAAKRTTKDILPHVDAKEFEETIWPRVEQQLCPSGLPQKDLGSMLFQLARNEFGFPADAPQPKPNFMKTVLIDDTVTNGYGIMQPEMDPTNAMVYLRLFKCANNQIRHWLKSHFNQVGREEEQKEGKRQREKLRQRTRERQLKKKKKPQKSEKSEKSESDTGPLHDLLIAKPRYKMKDQPGFASMRKDLATGEKNKIKPCTFTVIRDPISHFLSGYNEIEWRIITGKEIANVASVVKRGRFPSFTQLSHDNPRIRFEGFVRNFLQGQHGAYTGGATYWFMSHVYPLSRELHTIHRNGLKPHILPSVKDLTNTLPKFLEDKCPRFAKSYSPDGKLPIMEVTDKGTHESAKDPYGTYNTVKEIFSEGGRVAQALCMIHAFDYACFHGSSDLVPTLGAGDIPPVCKDVFASENFSTAIFNPGQWEAANSNNGRQPAKRDSYNGQGHNGRVQEEPEDDDDDKDDDKDDDDKQEGDELLPPPPQKGRHQPGWVGIDEPKGQNRPWKVGMKRPMKDLDDDVSVALEERKVLREEQMERRQKFREQRQKRRQTGARLREGR